MFSLLLQTCHKVNRDKNSNPAYELLSFLLSVFRRKKDVWGVGLVEMCMDQRLVWGEIWNQYASDNLKKTLQQSLRPYLNSIPHPTTLSSNRCVYHLPVSFEGIHPLSSSPNQSPIKVGRALEVFATGLYKRPDSPRLI